MHSTIIKPMIQPFFKGYNKAIEYQIRKRYGKQENDHLFVRFEYRVIKINLTI